MTSHKLTRILLGALLSLSACTAMAGAAPKERPLTSVEAGAFLKLDWQAQRLYVSGILDGLTFVSYGRKLPDHDMVVQCARNRTVDQVTRDVVEFVKTHPAFTESLGAAVTQSVSTACGLL